MINKKNISDNLTWNITDSMIDIVGDINQKPMNNIIPNPQEFFNQVIQLNEVLTVHQACNELLDKMSENLAVSTISKKLTAYKKLFYCYQHENPQLNEEVETKDGLKKQHIAARLLILSDEQKERLTNQRNNNENARAGFDNEGELREVDKPPIDIKAIIEKSCELLSSNDPHTIGCGILNLTGLRQNEQNIPARNYPQHDITIQREMIVVGEYLIAFKGISKKHSIDDINSYFRRVTLAPAQLIVDAQKRYLSSKDVQKLPQSYEKYEDSGFNGTFRERFNQHFRTALSTIEAYDDEGKLINNDGNGSPHKARAFYACAVRAILKAKGFTNGQTNKYIQLCLAHENIGITDRYLSRYDESEFINPIDINIPTNIKELGKMTTETIEKQIPQSTNTKTTKSKKAPKDTFDIDAFITALDPNLQLKFGELMNTESSLTNAVIAIVNAAKQTSVLETRVKKVSVSDEVAHIVTAIMEYNREQTLTTNRVVPTYSMINKISERCLNKTLHAKTVDNWLKANTELSTELTHLEIPEDTENSKDRTKWNGTHHRKTMDTVIESIISIFNER